MNLTEIVPNSDLLHKRYYFACYSAQGEEYLKTKKLADVIAFTCRITRENWIEITNRNAANRGKEKVAFKVTSSFIRRSILHVEKGDEFKFSPIQPDSLFYIGELAEKTYFFTEVIRNP